MRLVLVFFLISSFSRSVWAGSDVCEDLKPLVCSEKSRDDGTGKNPTLEELQMQIFKDINALTDVNRSKFSDLLENPEKQGWRKLVFDTFPIERKKCPRSEDLQKNPCRKIFANELAKIVDDEHLAPHSISEESLALRPPYEGKIRNIESLTGSLEYQTISEDHYQALRKLNRNPDQEKKIQSDLFPKVKQRLLEKIETLNVSTEAKSRMLEKVKALEFGGFDCEKGAKTDLGYIHAQYQAKTDVECDFTKSSACKVRVCRGTASQVTSEFSLVFILAHELSHSVDPCMLSRDDRKSDSAAPKNVADLDSQYPLKGVLSCLRGSKSIRAQNKMDLCRKLNKDKFADENCAISMTVAQNCNDDVSKNDQIGEAVADLFAADITYEIIQERHPDLTSEQWRNGASNLFPASQNCKPFKHRFDEHPEQMDRFNKIILAQPQFRTAMGCAKKSTQIEYCDPGFANVTNRESRSDKTDKVIGGTNPKTSPKTDPDSQR